MSDAEFIAIAKARAVIAEEKITGEIKVQERDNFQIVWLCHILGYKKCLVANVGSKEHLYHEVTYNREKNELYVDTYDKVRHEVRDCK